MYTEYNIYGVGYSPAPPNIIVKNGRGCKNSRMLSAVQYVQLPSHWVASLLTTYTSYMQFMFSQVSHFNT